MKAWEILNKEPDLSIEKLIKVLLENRGIKTKKEIDEFLNPDIKSLTAESLGIDKKSLSKSLSRIKKAIEKNEMVVVFGDYDVDGITGTAILWESLNGLGAKAMPYIPHRTEEGYGLSIVGIENLKKQYPETSLIITVDNGIVANSAVDFANSLNIDVIITDHHVPGKELPKSFGLVHSTKICGAAVAWFFSQELNPKQDNDHLALVALATVADLMKLTEFNRALLVEGLQSLHKTKRPGLIALLKIAGVEKETIGVYEIGHIIAPRINAMGRLESAMDSLRLICTKDKKRADELAQKLNETNIERQRLTFESFEHAKNLVGKPSKKLLFISHESYEPGVVGLIAGKISEEFYRPAIVASIGEKYTKASARSVSGFNIIEFIRLSSDFLVDAGGHPGAAGFTVETARLAELQKYLEDLAEKKLDESLLTRKLRVDCSLDLNRIDFEFFDELNKLSPFGYGNPEPTFLAKKVNIENMQFVGAEQKHLKFYLSQDGKAFSAIKFYFDHEQKFNVGDKIDIVYTIAVNEWNGNKKLELKIKDIRN